MIQATSSIRDIQGSLAELYGSTNADLTLDEIINRVSENCAGTCDLLTGELLPSEVFVRIFPWLFAYATRLDIDLEDASLRRYPECCPKCASRPCVCAATHKVPLFMNMGQLNISDELDAKFLTIRNAQGLDSTRYPSISLDWMAINLQRIYPSNTTIWTINPFYFSAMVLKRLGRLQNSFRKLKSSTISDSDGAIKRIIGSDLADLFAWCLTLWGLSDKEMLAAGVQESLVRRFNTGCPYCHSAPCACPSERRVGMRAELLAPKNNAEEINAQVAERIRDIIKALDDNPVLQEKAESILRPDDLPKDKSELSKRIRSTGEAIQEAGRVSAGAEKAIRGIAKFVEWADRFLL